jgi:hypothetical protein
VPENFNDQVARHEDGRPVTLDEFREMMREERVTAQALYGAATPAVPAAPPAPAPPLDPVEAKRQATREALAAADAAREAKRNLAESAREKFFEDHGFRITASDDEVFQMFGLSDRPLTAVEERRQRKQERDTAILTDAAADAAYRHEQAVKRFRQQFWGLSVQQRQDRAVELGLTPENFTPPTTPFDS